MQHCDRWSLQSEVRRGQAPLSLFYCNLCIYCICNCLSLYVQFISGATPKWFSSRTCKICLKWLWKKSHNLHNLLHNSSFISCNLLHKFRVIWVFFFYHTLSESLCLLQVNTSLVVLIFYMYSSSIMWPLMYLMFLMSAPSSCWWSPNIWFLWGHG